MQFAEETAIVSDVDGDFVFLETQNKASCNNCSSKAGCGQVSSIFSIKRRNRLIVNNTLSLKVGDSVVVGMASGKLLFATMLMYLLPLLFLLVFSFLAKVQLGENASIFFGLMGLLSGLLLVKRITRLQNIASNFHPKLIRKIITVNQK